MAVPLLIRKIPYLCPGHDHRQRDICYKTFIFIFSFVCYTAYHLSRNPISVVKSVLYHKNCSDVLHDNTTKTSDPHWCDWAPFNKDNAGELLGILDMTYFSVHALALFLSGYIADRFNIRYCLTIGMIGTGIFIIGFGLGYFWNIHSFVFFLAVHSIAGFFQATGYPCMMTCMGNWFGKTRRGLFMAVWHTNTNVGNILGFLIAGIFVDEAWGWSFVVPGMIIGSLGVLVLLILVPKPEDVDCTNSDHYVNREGQNISSYNDRDTNAKETIAGETSALQSGIGIQCQSIDKKNALSIREALMIPGVLEFCLSKFFVSIVWYTLLQWLPKYITVKTTLSAEDAAYTTTMYDIGGLLGGILAGYISDHRNTRGLTCVIFMITAAPLLFIYDNYGSEVPFFVDYLFLILCGASIYGPYTVMGTAVCLDLGTHKSLRNNIKASGIVTAIIVSAGMIGAAVGPVLAGVISSYGWHNVFYMIIIADCLAALSLSRVVYKEIREMVNGYEEVVTTDTVMKPTSKPKD